MKKLKSEEIIKKTIFENIDVKKYKIFLFGSRANGNFRENSDYDIGILGKEKMNFLDLLKLKRILRKLPYLIDLVDFNMVDENFKKIALNKIIKWN